MSDRHFGIGSDGIVLIMPSEVADCRMRMFNADGSEAEMCGNASRCVGKYVYDRGIVKKNLFVLNYVCIKVIEVHTDSRGQGRNSYCRYGRTYSCTKGYSCCS